MIIRSGGGMEMVFVNNKYSRHKLAIYTLSAFCLAFGLAHANAGEEQGYDIDQRIACQTTLEDLRWDHVTWPKENPEPKPTRSIQLSDAQIRAKVEDDLRMESALLAHYGVEITDAMLQAELDRMATNTRDPKRLQQMFDALGSDPRRVAECIARPNLVSAKLHSHFAWDSSLHADKRIQAEAAAQETTDPAQPSSGHVQQHVFQRAGKADGVAEPRSPSIALDDAEFDALSRQLSPQPAKLRETENAFVRAQIISQTDSQIEVRALVWPKASFSDWWHLESERQPLSQPRFESTLVLPAINVIRTTTEESTRAGSIDYWRVNPLKAPPSARYHHTAVWTGAEMLVWGGTDGNLYLNTGARYNPGTDTWLAIEEAGAPSGRDFHTAVWTGTEMIVWGGESFDASSNFQVLNNGGRYNPTTDDWLPTTLTNAPTARSAHGTVWSGTEMIIWGGAFYDAQGDIELPITGGRYNPGTDTWTATSLVSAPSGRYYVEPVWTGSEMIVWGGAGYDAQGDIELPTTGGRYNPASNTWTATSTINAPVGRKHLTTIWTGSEMIVWGGEGFDAQGGDLPLGTGGRYNPSNNTWTSTTAVNAPSARSSHSAIWTGTQMIVWGGFDATDALASGARYNPGSNTWQATNSIGQGVPSARGIHTAVWTGTQMIIWGGFDNTNNPTSSGARYNPTSDAWVATDQVNPPAARLFHSAVWTGNEMIVWGGFDGVALNTGGRYTPATDQWAVTGTSNVPSARYYHSAVWTGDRMLVWGGNGASALNTGASYNPISNAWTVIEISGAPSARFQHTAVWTGSRMIIWGGDSGTNKLNTGAAYNPSTNSWAATNSGSAPGARRSHTAVWSGTEMIVWGGISTSVLNDGSRYNPNTDSWNATSGSSAPTGRNSHAAVWTGSRMIIWGGAGSSVQVNTGGVYNPSANTWTATSNTGAPPASSSPTAVWTGSEMIVWGGVGAGGAFLNSGGRYNPTGNTWSATTLIQAPNGRVGHSAIWTGLDMIVWGGDLADNFAWLYDPDLFTSSVQITIMGSGGRVVSQPTGIDCTSSCNAEVATDTDLSLHLLPDAFSGWTEADAIWLQDCAGTLSTDPCLLTVNGDKLVTVISECGRIETPANFIVNGLASNLQCNRIHAIANYQIQGPAGNQTFQATQHIKLGPGFSVGAGGVFRAVILSN